CTGVSARSTCRLRPHWRRTRSPDIGGPDRLVAPTPDRAPHMTTERNADPSHETVPSIGRRRFIQAAGAAAGATALTAAVPSGRASAAVPAGASSFVPLPTAVRLADTRSAGQY